MADVFYVASRKGLFTYRRNGADWNTGAPDFLGEPVSAVLRDKRDSAVYAALNLGHFGCKLHRSDDDGGSWKELTPPAFAKAEDGDENAPSVNLIWALETGGDDEPGVIWAGVNPGALFKSEDRGESWTLIESLWNREEREGWFGGGYDKPGIHSVLVDPRDSKKLTLGISCGGVWKSDDGGANWRLTGDGLRSDYMPPDQSQDLNTQDPHRLASCASDPDTIWCQHHNGIFLSRDGGETFSEFKDVKPAVFGFAVAVHPNDPDTAWLVPGVKDEFRVPVDAKLVVNKTTDGGKSFTPQSNGLPEPSFDLVYRHALDVDETGERLVMGSTTGNLWASDDGGTNWRQLSAHLPPIAQVAFG
ncbi:WD40/YVTN/BNR-like repeat-containing protein [Marinicaulis aureus]|uniref:WD40/YVTN/BNR-like repeat-containing protein n=1 Tax=Hyphococcus aureus TaxID=2666033 RepID=A0ABW1KZG2_9PROT